MVNHQEVNMAAKKSMKLGGGGRFAKIAASAGGGKKGAAIAAAIGRKKYGAKKMGQLSAAGRRRASRARKRK
jgi:hypothetical protein